MTLGEARDLIECELMAAAESGAITDYQSSYLTDGLGVLYAHIAVALPMPLTMIEISFVFPDRR